MHAYRRGTTPSAVGRQLRRRVAPSERVSIEARPMAGGARRTGRYRYAGAAVVPVMETADLGRGSTRRGIRSVLTRMMSIWHYSCHDVIRQLARRARGCCPPPDPCGGRRAGRARRTGGTDDAGGGRGVRRFPSNDLSLLPDTRRVDRGGGPVDRQPADASSVPTHVGRGGRLVRGRLPGLRQAALAYLHNMLAYTTLREESGLDGEEIGRAIGWAIRTLVDDLRRRYQ
jgi:hypothetical protein